MIIELRIPSFSTKAFLMIKMVDGTVLSFSTFPYPYIYIYIYKVGGTKP
jgi:hypothetical protein